MYDCPHYASRPFTGWKIMVPLQQPDLENLVAVEDMENRKPEECNSHETSFVYIVTGGQGKDKEIYVFIFTEQKTKGSSENLRITAQLEERDAILTHFQIFPSIVSIPLNS